MLLLHCLCFSGEIAQLARAIGSYPIGRGFNPLSRYHKKITQSHDWVFICFKIVIFEYNLLVINMFGLEDALYAASVLGISFDRFTVEDFLEA